MLFRIENLRRDINRTTGILLSAQVARDLDRDLQQLLDKLSAENQVEGMAMFLHTIFHFKVCTSLHQFVIGLNK